MGVSKKRYLLNDENICNIYESSVFIISISIHLNICMFKNCSNNVTFKQLFHINKEVALY